MPSQPASGSGWTPSWRRLAGSTVVLFVVILAFLVGRVRAGTDPGLAGQTTPAPQQQQTQPQSTPGFDPGGSSGAAPPAQVDPNDPNDPFADPQQQGGGGFDPSTGSDPGTGSDDNFGNAVPDGSSSSGNGSDGSGQGNQSADPPSTHVS